MKSKGSLGLYADLNFSNEKLAFESSDNSKVLVNATGKITTVSAGNATITVTVKDSDVKMTIFGFGCY